MNKNKISLLIAIILSILTVVLIFSALTMFFKQENGQLSTPGATQEATKQDAKNQPKSDEADKKPAQKSDEAQPETTGENPELDKNSTKSEVENLPSTGVSQPAPAELPRTGVSR